jgi:hypothetical protein
VPRGADQDRPEGHSGIGSKASTTCRPTPPLSASIEDEIRLKNRLRGAVANHEGPRSENPDQPSAKVGNLAAE